MFQAMLFFVLIILAAAILFCLYRVLRGPSMSDRVIALDNIGINLIAVTAVLSILLDTDAFLSIILLIGILSFIGTISFSKFLERGVVIERRRNQ